jgi:hypothetical protein
MNERLGERFEPVVTEPREGFTDIDEDPETDGVGIIVGGLGGESILADGREALRRCSTDPDFFVGVRPELPALRARMESLGQGKAPSAETRNLTTSPSEESSANHSSFVGNTTSCTMMTRYHPDGSLAHEMSNASMASQSARPGPTRSFFIKSRGWTPFAAIQPGLSVMTSSSWE